MAVAFGFRGSGRRGGTPALPVRPASLVVEPGGTSVSTHGRGDLFTALRRQGLIADEFVLQLTTFLRSLDLFLELIVLTPRTLTANQVRHGGKQGTDNPKLSRIHSSTCPVLTSLPRSPAQRLTISLTSRSFWSASPYGNKDRLLQSLCPAYASHIRQGVPSRALSRSGRIPFRPIPRLAQNEERGHASREAGSGGGLGPRLRKIRRGHSPIGHRIT